MTRKTTCSLWDTRPPAPRAGHILEGRTPAKAAIHRLTGYSAHADQQTLTAWVAAMPEPPGEIRLVHGDPAAQIALTSLLTD